VPFLFGPVISYHSSNDYRTRLGRQYVVGGVAVTSQGVTLLELLDLEEGEEAEEDEDEEFDEEEK
jgi:hypothetical protein